METLSLHDARRMAVSAQGLDRLPASQTSVAAVINRLGYLQIDTISVVARTHEHTLWARLPDFTPQELYAAQRDEHSIFEYWGHAMSYLPVQDYRYYLPTMRSFYDKEKGWAKNRYECCGHLIEPVLERIKTEGPLRSRDFEQEPSDEQRTWWNWHPHKMVLELLLWRGDLMVSERQGFQKVYDLAERVLPTWVDTSYPTDEELGRFVVIRTLQAYGVASEKDIRGFIHDFTNDTVQAGLSSLLDEGKIMAVQIEGLNGTPYYVLDGQLDSTQKTAANPKGMHILSPFDNFIIQRERLAKLFDFEYSLECYLPAAKRVYGYYVMPILYGTEMIGRIDPKADRKARQLQLRSLYFEDGFKPDEAFFVQFSERLQSMMQFNGCKQIALGNISNETFREPMLKVLKERGVLAQAIQ
jgi:uncharacterized protein